ncbi:hypothetical protein SAMN04487943_102403 [Gracilibacillus orientalis]|uniref:Uncharacterized protein n=1 Tax=Gracilibacillus orientalis TaxID=334253 RepID=A0A1I4J1Y3_9BACI|nr:hypothetical protein [Gracilibacillus orientalis]SFL60203.1 hypothetical protein SAMN04487943_102403 [Gracilibacillus orientalis]
MGENVLVYLLFSNIFIFSLDNALNLIFVGPWQGFFFSLMLLLVITYFIKLTSRVPRNNAPLKMMRIKAEPDQSDKKMTKI